LRASSKLDLSASVQYLESRLPGALRAPFDALFALATETTLTLAFAQAPSASDFLEASWLSMKSSKVGVLEKTGFPGRTRCTACPFVSLTAAIAHLLYHKVLALESLGSQRAAQMTISSRVGRDDKPGHSQTVRRAKTALEGQSRPSFQLLEPGSRTRSVALRVNANAPFRAVEHAIRNSLSGCERGLGNDLVNENFYTKGKLRIHVAFFAASRIAHRDLAVMQIRF